MYDDPDRHGKTFVSVYDRRDAEPQSCQDASGHHFCKAVMIKAEVSPAPDIENDPRQAENRHGHSDADCRTS